MDEHIKKVHEEQKETCHRCQKQFKHVRLHTKFCGVLDEICPKCNKKTLRLKLHMKTCQQKETCPRCQKQFKHVRQHTKFCGVQEEICPKCKKMTLRLKVHMKTCDGRSKKFTRAQLIIEAIYFKDEVVQSGRLTTRWH